MLLQHVRAILPESVDGLPLDQLVDEVGGLQAPVVGDVLGVDLLLLGKNVVSDLLPVLALVWSLAKHALVGDDSHCKVVHCNAVVLSAHDLGCHVAWSSRGILGVLGLPESGDTKISHPEVAIFVKDKVLWLDVSVEDGVLVQVLQTEQHAGNEELSLFLAKTTVSSDMVSEVSTRHHVDDQVKVLSVFKSVVHIDQESK